MPTDYISINEYEGSKITKLFENFSLNYQIPIFIITLIVISISLFGISKLKSKIVLLIILVKTTEIYKGMKLIDEELGGTTPLEVILKFPDTKKNNDEDEKEDDFEDWDEDSERRR